jgi:hypothetical protein
MFLLNATDNFFEMQNATDNGSSHASDFEQIWVLCTRWQMDYPRELSPQMQGPWIMSPLWGTPNKNCIMYN